YPRAKGSAGKSGQFRRPTLADMRYGGHRHGGRGIKVDLDLLPADDRPVVARALADDPADRFPSCTALVEALEAATGRPEPGELRPDLFASLPLVLPFASLLGQQSPADFAVPALGPVLNDLVTNATGSVSVLEFENVRYLLHGDGSWEYRCP